MSIRRHKGVSRVVRATAGCLLLCSSLFVAYVWFYRWAPMRHMVDPDWQARYSKRTRWEEEQKGYRRQDSSPDLCMRGDRIGYYGDRQWCLWLIGKMEKGRGFRVCGCTHAALMYMTNRRETSWSDWARTHGHQTQEEWIRDGFAEVGVTVHLPPVPEDTDDLLALLGKKEWNVLWGVPSGNPSPEAVPSFLKYNAFRWLRDSGFHPTEYVASHAATPLSQEQILGLVEYGNRAASFPRRDGLGVLAFGHGEESTAPPWNRPRILAPGFALTVYALILVPAAAGVALLALPRRKRMPPPSHSALP